MPYVGAGVLASSLCMDKVVFKEVLAAADVPQVALRGRARGALARRARGRRCASWPCSARRCSSSRRGSGSSVGIAKVWSEAELGPALDAAFAPRLAGDRRGRSRPAWRSSARCSATATPEASVPGEIVLHGRRLVRLRGQVHRRRDGAAWSRPGCPTPVLEEVRRLAVDTFLRVGCAGLARVDFFVEDGERVLVNELNTMPGFTVTSVFPKLWEAVGRAVPGALRPAARTWRSSASRAERCERLQPSKQAATLLRRAGSRRSRRARRPAASLVIQTR